MSACSGSFQRKLLFSIGFIVGIFVASVPIFNDGIGNGAAIVMFVVGLGTFVVSFICLARECCCSQRNEVYVHTDVRRAAEEPPPPPYTHTRANVSPVVPIIYPPPSYYDTNGNVKEPV